MAAAGFERHVLRLCGVVACVLLLCLSAAPALAQDEPGRGTRTAKDVPPSVERLWKEYPLNPTPAGDAPSSTERTRSGAPRPGSTSARGTEDDGFPTGPVTLVFVGVAIALFAVLALSALTPTLQPRHARQRVALHLPRFRNGRSRIVARRRRPVLPGGWWGDDDGGETSRAPSKPTSEGSAVGEEIFVAQYLRARSDPMSNQPEQPRPESGAPDEREVVAHEPVDSDTATDYIRAGEQVTAVLASAQQAADQMLRSARDEADRVRSEALEQAAASTAEALSEATRIQSESKRLRLEVETYRKETRDAADAHAAKTRAEAEPEAERRLAEADEHAQAIIAEAEQRARHVAQEEVRRQEALAAGAERYEERLKTLLEVFRGMATQLEDLIRTDREAKDREEDSEEAEQEAETPADEALEEALRPERQTHARPT